MKLIAARDTGADYLFRVHLDGSKVRDGEPDSEWVEEFRFDKKPPEGRTKAQYLADCKREVRLLCQAMLARRRGDGGAGTKLPGEGEEF